MGDRYNLYESLKLDSAASTEELHANLSNQLSELRDAGVSEYSGEFQEKLTALQVLGDEGRRREYDALLADENATITIATLRGLANRPVPTAQESSFQTQTQQAQWSAPTQTSPATVTTTVTTDVPPLPANATLQNMWQRMPLIPRITTGLVSFSTLIGIIAVLYAITLGIQGANDLGSLESSLGDSWDDIGYIMGAAAALVLVPVLLLMGMMLVTLTAYWIHSILRGEDSTAPIFFCVTVAPLALAMTIIPLLFLSSWVDVVLFLAGAMLIAACVLMFLKDMRAWFRGQKLVRTTQSAPGQGYAPQYPQSQNTQGYQFGQNNPPNNTQN
ncbi:molecular chaperone DnaJ [Corynebacterium sp. MSK151]|uniref:molecular chaperone DnaJ n=1 Tax=Corynebacterium TaxID=1716 RepID=UPI0008A15527|nr:MULTISPECIES: molecular chaperone DnaJ [unclassified Corynebacterium]MBC6748114.1 molecular chaperone DnaJ [Corynebacterium sp. LK25]MDK8758973.1 molecular chaperone DnaJ [Corynebacterium sp. MSK151]MDK8848044.1 molecular chaperone DnaJ [Corynebacterium sp. MSK047]OFT69295.1 molecular chaperone DnaJ [Corynebacterium sp. HMSC14B06]TXS59742.1 molecular chaperone DnaJ [Corynebacterium sp. LK19]